MGRRWFVKNLNKNNEIFRCRKILEDFVEAVLELNSEKWFVPEYNVTSIRKVFVDLAALIIDAEIGFDKARRLKERYTEHIMYCANLLKSRQENFEKAKKAAKDNFGIEFKSADLFADAEKLGRIV